jgi:hypothetical protein
MPLCISLHLFLYATCARAPPVLLPYRMRVVGQHVSLAQLEVQPLLKSTCTCADWPMTHDDTLTCAHHAKHPCMRSWSGLCSRGVTQGLSARTVRIHSELKSRVNTVGQDLEASLAAAAERSSYLMWGMTWATLNSNCARPFKNDNSVRVNIPTGLEFLPR